MPSSRSLAKTWSYPRHSNFERHTRKAAAKWFIDKGYRTQSRYPYILEQYSDWPSNIILPDVAEYIRQRRAGFPLHKYIHHGLSSQAMLFNLIGPLIVWHDLEPLTSVMGNIDIPAFTAAMTAELEYENRVIFNEDSGQPTSIDLVLSDAQGKPFLFVESKFVERGFGGCSVFAAGDCDGRNPAHNFELCYLHHIGRKYWELLEKHGFLPGLVGQNATCILSDHYQFFRELLTAVELGGMFVLLHDTRNPAFECENVDGKRGLIPFLLEFVPPHLKSRVSVISIQAMVEAIKTTGRHGWISEFEHKYGLA